MKKLIVALALLVPATVFGQTFYSGARVSVGADYKISKGFHIEAEEEMRTAENFAGLGSMRTTLGMTYKPVKFLKLGVGYTLINPYKINKEITDASGNTTQYNGFWAPRHRLYADVTGTLKAGAFNFSLKERLQFTHNAYADLNPYQTTRNALGLKSRLAVKYKGWQYVEPSLSLEARLALNDPWGTTSGSEQETSSGKKYYSYTHTGYTHAYLNRIRVNLGADILLSMHSTLSPYILFDYNSDYEIDTNGADKWASKGVRLFTETTGWVYSYMLTVGLSYKYSF